MIAHNLPFFEYSPLSATSATQLSMPHSLVSSGACETLSFIDDSWGYEVDRNCGAHKYPVRFLVDGATNLSYHKCDTIIINKPVNNKSGKTAMSLAASAWAGFIGF
jgi:hypothetical protein